MSSGGVTFEILLTLHLIGLALGLGGAALTDFSFIRVLRLGDRITPETVTWMRSFSMLIWVGLGILGVSGVGLFLLSPHKYLLIPGFLAKMVFVGILIVNGLFLNFYTTARLTTFNFSEKYQRHGAAWKARKLSFIFGAVSTTTWYAALFAAMFKTMVKLQFYQYLVIYAAVLGLAIICALVLEWRLSSRKRPMAPTIDKLALAAQSDPSVATIVPSPANAQPMVNRAAPIVSPKVVPLPVQPAPSQTSPPTAVTVQPPATLPGNEGLPKAQGQL